MKHSKAIQKCLIFGLVLMVCTGTVGAVQARRAAAPQVSIQFLIDIAPDGGTVNIQEGTFSETLLVDKNLTLKGVSPTETILQPKNANQRVITVTERHNLRLESLRVTGGHPTAIDDDSGGGVYLAGGSLELDQVRIDNNKAAYGGGVFQKGSSGSVTAINSMIENNTASFNGGGMFVAGSATLTDTSLVNNTASNHGGGMHVNTGAASLTGGAVTGNHALYGNGGGVNVNNGLVVTSTTFTNNMAAGISDFSGSGGAITQWNDGQTVSIKGATFNGNSAQVNGGAVYIKQSFLTLTNSTFTSNTVDSGTTANTYGGGVYAGGGLDGSGLTFTSNLAKCTGCSFQRGGGLHIMRTSPGASTITLSTFDGNKAWSGSGISSGTSVQLTLTSSTFINNGSLASGVFTGYGGGVDAYWVNGDKLLFQNNRAMNAGGALKANHLILTNSLFFGNVASNTGGGAVYASYDFTGTNLLFAGNDSLNGAAVYVENGPVVLKHLTIGRPARGAGSGLYVKAGATLELKNSIISANDVGLRVLGTATEDYNLYFNNRVDSDAAGGGTIVSGGHNVAPQDPLFANPAGNDYHLRPASPAIGKGTDLGTATDLDGRARLGRMDIGAYQFWTFVYVPMLRK